MKIVYDYPINIVEIRNVLRIPKGAIFVFGRYLHNPENVPISNELVAYAEVLSNKQLAYEGGAGMWWRDYLEDVDFRFEEEVEARRAQYRAYCNRESDGGRRALYLHVCAFPILSLNVGRSLKECTAALRA